MDSPAGSSDGNRTHTVQSPTPQRSRRRGRRSRSPQCIEDPMFESPQMTRLEGNDPYLFTPDPSAQRSIPVAPISMPTRVSTRTRSTYFSPLMDSQELVTLHAPKDVEIIEESRNYQDTYSQFSQSQYMNQSQYEKTSLPALDSVHVDGQIKILLPPQMQTSQSTESREAIVSRQPSSSFDLFSQSDVYDSSMATSDATRSIFSQQSQLSSQQQQMNAHKIPYFMYCIPLDVSSMMNHDTVNNINSLNLTKVTEQYLHYCLPSIDIPPLTTDITMYTEEIIQCITLCIPFSMTLLSKLLPTIFTNTYPDIYPHMLPCLLVPSHTSMVMEFQEDMHDFHMIHLQPQYIQSVIRERLRLLFACREQLVGISSNDMSICYMSRSMQDYINLRMYVEMCQKERYMGYLQHTDTQQQLVDGTNRNNTIYYSVEQEEEDFHHHHYTCIHCGYQCDTMPTTAVCNTCQYVHTHIYQPKHRRIDLSTREIEKWPHMHNPSIQSLQPVYTQISQYAAVEQYIQGTTCLLLQVMDLPCNQDFLLCTVQAVYPGCQAVQQQSTAIPVMVPTQLIPARTIRGSFFYLFPPYTLQPASYYTSTEIILPSHSYSDAEFNSSNQLQGDILSIRSKNNVLYFDSSVRSKNTVYNSDIDNEKTPWPILSAQVMVNISLDTHPYSLLNGDAWLPVQYVQDKQFLTVKQTNPRVQTQAEFPFVFPSVGKNVKSVLNALMSIRLEQPSLDTSVFLQDVIHLPSIVSEPFIPLSPNLPYIPPNRFFFILPQERPVTREEIEQASMFDRTQYDRYHAKPSGYVSEVTRQSIQSIERIVRSTCFKKEYVGICEYVHCIREEEKIQYLVFLQKEHPSKFTSVGKQIFQKFDSPNCTISPALVPGTEIPLQELVPGYVVDNVQEQFQYKPQMYTHILQTCVESLTGLVLDFPAGVQFANTPPRSTQQWLFLNKSHQPQDTEFYLQNYDFFFSAYSASSSSRQQHLGTWESIPVDKDVTPQMPKEIIRFDAMQEKQTRKIDFHPSLYLLLFLACFPTTQSIQVDIHVSQTPLSSIPALRPYILEVPVEEAGRPTMEELTDFLSMQS